MNIALNALAVRPRLSGGGVYVTNLVRHLSNLDSKNQYTVYATRENAGHFAGLGNNFQLVRRTARRPLRVFWEQTGLPFDLKRRGVDIFHGTGFVSPLLRACRQVTTIHDMTFFVTPEHHTGVKRAYFRTLIPLTARRSDLIIAVSQSARDDIVRLLRIAPEKIRVVAEGCEERFQPLEGSEALDTVRRKYGFNKKVILFVGVIEPRKNLVTLLEAFAALHELHSEYCLVLAGDWGWDYEPVLAAVERLGLKEQVRFPGFIPAEELPALYNLAELFVYPSWYEGFGLPVLEAMACGTPVVTSNVSSLPEVAGDAALLVDPRSVAELSEAMSRVLSDADLRARLRAKGLERRRQFTWDKTARETLRVYEELAGK